MRRAIRPGWRGGAAVRTRPRCAARDEDVPARGDGPAQAARDIPTVKQGPDFITLPCRTCRPHPVERPRRGEIVQRQIGEDIAAQGDGVAGLGGRFPNDLHSPALTTVGHVTGQDGTIGT